MSYTRCSTLGVVRCPPPPARPPTTPGGGAKKRPQKSGPPWTRLPDRWDWRFKRNRAERGRRRKFFELWAVGFGKITSKYVRFWRFSGRRLGCFGDRYTHGCGEVGGSQCLEKLPKSWPAPARAGYGAGHDFGNFLNTGGHPRGPSRRRPGPVGRAFLGPSGQGLLWRRVGLAWPGAIRQGVARHPSQGGPAGCLHMHTHIRAHISMYIYIYISHGVH